MGEGIHSPVSTKPGNRRKWTFIIAGTAMALLVTGVLVQVLRPVPAFPGDNQEQGEGAPAGRQQGNYLAKVGNVFISHDDVAREVMEKHGAEALDNLINRQIIANACRDQGVVVTRAEVEQEITNIAKNFQLPKQTWMEMLQRERNITGDQYRRDIIWPMIALRKLAGEAVEVSPSEMKLAFERNYGPKVKVRAIVINNGRRAAEVWKKAVEHPEDFGKLARQHSEDAGSRPLDGVVPPIRRHGPKESKALEEAAFKLKPGEISGVINVENQWIILMCDGFTDQVVQNMADVQEVLEKDLREEKQQKSVAEVFKKLREHTRVDNYLRGTAEGGRKGSSVQPVSGKNPTRRVTPASADFDSPTNPQGAARNARPTSIPNPADELPTGE